MMEDVERLVLPFSDHPRKWLALDVSTNEVVAKTDTPEEMIAYLRQHRIEGVAMVRAPAENEPLYLSLR